MTDDNGPASPEGMGGSVKPDVMPMALRELLYRGRRVVELHCNGNLADANDSHAINLLRGAISKVETLLQREATTANTEPSA